jgi:hypothetical protein
VIREREKEREIKEREKKEIQNKGIKDILLF